MDWIVNKISEFEGARHFSPKHPESQIELPCAFDSVGREPLLYIYFLFEKRKCHQGSNDVRAQVLSYLVTMKLHPTLIILSYLILFFQVCHFPAIICHYLEN